ncbi:MULTISPECIES: type I 3-dehydroquinate dehydratase [Staphylococcus]|uniref:type I 3-dehydroquinate dehydratase n=1 Tax=Staphylococcus TaxID=1279 RepID=UPI0008A19F0E|nr:MULTISPECIES: type I 3-dehydroquinate dehydratase [Staphylococcus]ARB78305.1 type I 3-dehydroquinate dehydratase [Staphylococcus lugdunensis]ARJ19430.1 type I 3-dehydroquinate dehydratase [Staphylococcus lugdunensis]MBM7132983.1 type I 3-dehydroquinate dehydratase [Staphylococcus lugdunensis]MCH8641391.1 type I 3-dehydroquinate dehydratase [Staphylococcus lugdunensis]MCH8644905.1 type I 3-dehydroquinate dehydratase [Staphylococcus lugdunensis]
MTKVNIAATIAPKGRLDHTLLAKIERDHHAIDIIELRIDQWQTDIDRLLQDNLEQLVTLSFKPQILVTYRTESQGGQGVLDEQNYLALLKRLAKVQGIDMVDVEWHNHLPFDIYHQCISHLKAQHKAVILSHHNFQHTPESEALHFIFYKMSQFPADYLKLAVMPENQSDVLRLLDVLSITAQSVDQQVIGISMSSLGVISRTAQGLFGGTMSYGCIDTPKAPGQIQVTQLHDIINFYQKYDN